MTAIAVLACLGGLASAPAQAQPADDFVPVTDAILQNPAQADWLMWRRTLDGWGYSPLDQITRENVGDLRMVWTRALTRGSQQGTPLAYDGVLYMPNPRDVIQAIDAVTGDLKREHRREVPERAGGGLVFGGDVNGRVRAFDQETGDVLWELNLGSSVTGFSITYAVDGRQYVAFSTGTAANAGINLRMTPELRPSAGNNLFVFALPERE